MLLCGPQERRSNGDVERRERKRETPQDCAPVAGGAGGSDYPHSERSLGCLLPSPAPPISLHFPYFSHTLLVGFDLVTGDECCCPDDSDEVWPLLLRSWVGGDVTRTH